jgi:hypothetical protein
METTFQKRHWRREVECGGEPVFAVSGDDLLFKSSDGALFACEQRLTFPKATHNVRRHGNQDPS